MASPAEPAAAQHQESHSEHADGKDKDAQLQQALHRLDEAYVELDAKEELLNNVMRKLKEDESCLRQAIKEASSAYLPQAQKRTLKDAEAVRRLEQALLGSSSDDETSDGS
jgi:hypothetical protein